MAIAALSKWSTVLLPFYVVGCGSSAVEGWTLNRKSPGSNPIAAVLKLGHFCSVRNAPVHSAVQFMSTWL